MSADCGSEGRGFEPRRSPRHLQVKCEDRESDRASFTATYCNPSNQRPRLAPQRCRHLCPPTGASRYPSSARSSRDQRAARRERLVRAGESAKLTNRLSEKDPTSAAGASSIASITGIAANPVRVRRFTPGYTRCHRCARQRTTDAADRDISPGAGQYGILFEWSICSRLNRFEAAPSSPPATNARATDGGRSSRRCTVLSRAAASKVCGPTPWPGRRESLRR